MCASGIGFSLEPALASDPFGREFRKNYYPERCADLWNDLPAGQIMFEADWWLKSLCHDIDRAGRKVIPSLRPIEEWYRRLPVVVGEEVVTRLWVSAEAITVTETASSIFFHNVNLRIRASSMKRDAQAPTGLRQVRGVAARGLMRVVVVVVVVEVEVMVVVVV